MFDLSKHLGLVLWCAWLCVEGMCAVRDLGDTDHHHERKKVRWRNDVKGYAKEEKSFPLGKLVDKDNPVVRTSYNAHDLAHYHQQIADYEYAQKIARKDFNLVAFADVLSRKLEQVQKARMLPRVVVRMKHEGEYTWLPSRYSAQRHCKDIYRPAKIHQRAPDGSFGKVLQRDHDKRVLLPGRSERCRHLWQQNAHQASVLGKMLALRVRHSHQSRLSSAFVGQDHRVGKKQ